jgi:hypothetical protein
MMPPIKKIRINDGISADKSINNGRITARAALP